MKNEQDQIESEASAEAGKLLAPQAWTSARFVMAQVGSNSAAIARFARPGRCSAASSTTSRRARHSLPSSKAGTVRRALRTT